jgi:hypothetical protein
VKGDPRRRRRCIDLEVEKDGCWWRIDADCIEDLVGCCIAINVECLGTKERLAVGCT